MVLAFSATIRFWFFISCEGQRVENEGGHSGRCVCVCVHTPMPVYEDVRHRSEVDTFGLSSIGKVH